MKHFFYSLLVLGALLLSPVDVLLAGNNGATDSSSDSGDPDGKKDGDDQDSNTDGNGQDGFTGDQHTDNCSVVYSMNVGEFQSDFGGQDVYLKIKRLKPSPLLFTPQSLQFDSPLASDVFQLPEAAEAQAVTQAETTVEVAESELADATSFASTAEQSKDAAFTVLTQEEQALATAVVALDADPEDTVLQQAVVTATAQRDAAQASYDTALASFTSAEAGFAAAQQSLLSAQGTLTQAESTYASFVASQESAGTLVNNAAGVALSQIQIQRPKGTLIAYKPDGASGLWKPQGREVNYASRVQAISSDSFARIDGRGNSFIFSSEEGSLPQFKMPSGRLVAASSDGVGQEVVRESGVLRQICTPQALSDIVVMDAHAYEVRLYKPENMGSKNAEGIFEPTGSPFTSFKVENPTGDVNQLNRVKITTTKGAFVDVAEWEYTEATNAWALRTGEGADTVRIGKTITEVAPGEQIYEWNVINDANEVVETRRETIETFAWGDKLTRQVIDPTASNRVTTFSYHTNAAEGDQYGKLATQTNPDGSWMSHDYDAIGREVQMLEPWLDAPVGSPAEQAKATYYDYTPVDSRDTSLDYDRRPRTKTVEILGQLTEKSFYAYFENASGEFVEIEEMAATATAHYGESANLRRTKTYYAANLPEALSGRLKTEAHPDGRLDTYSYTRLADKTFITTVRRGVVEAPDGVAYKTTREVTTLDPFGNETVRASYVYTGSSYELIETIDQVFNERGQITERRRNGRILYSASYANGLMVSETGEQGITTTYTHDSQERVQTRTKVGLAGQADIVTTFTYDAKNRIVAQEVAGGALSLSETWVYDGAGRVLSYTDAAGYTTTYLYENDGRKVTQTNPDTSIVITERHLDQQLKSVSGTGVVDAYYAYTIHSDGSLSTEQTMGRSDSLRVLTTVRDVLNRVVEISRPAFDGGLFVQTLEYDEGGRLIRQAETERADTLFTYDSARQPLRSGLDIDGNGSLDLASEDRISEVETSFYQDALGHWWRSQEDRVYAEATVATATTVRETRQQLSGLAINEASDVLVLDTQGNQTSTRAIIDHANASMTVTTDLPESSLDAIDSYVNGLLQSRRSSSVATPVTFTYDALARRISRQEPRHTGSQEWIFDTLTGQLVAEKDAAGEQTDYSYYPQGIVGAGRLASITDALGQVSYRSYNLRGQSTQTWGASSYPVAFNYNEFGEQTTMVTYRSGDATYLWTQPTWPLSPPAGDSTTWVYDEATGLLTDKTDAAGASMSYHYSPAGRMSERFWARLDTQANPLQTSYSYDLLTGERIGVDYADSTPDISYSFDRLGRLDVVTDAVGTRNFAYRSDLQLASESIIGFYGGDKRISRSYETGSLGTHVIGRYIGFELGVVADPDADSAVTYGFDSYGRLDTVADPTANFSYSYLADSDRLASLSSPVHTASYSYEANRDVKTVVDNTVSGMSVSNYAYTYDAIGRRSRRVQSGSAFTQSSFDAFGYNSRSEVIASDRYLGTDPADLSQPVLADAFDYAYDPIGNRLSATEAGASASYSSNALNQYTAISGLSTQPSHDADGNLLVQGDWVYQWNGENRLVEAYSLVEDKQLEFLYDYMGRRVEKKVTQISTETVSSETRFLYDGWNLVSTYQFQTSVFTLQTAYTWGLDLSQSSQGAGGVGGLLGVEELSGAHQGVYHFAFDANGNVTEVLDTSGGIAAHYEYSPFGEMIRFSGSYADANPFRFSSKYLDVEAGFYYYGYRHYDPATGRWSSRDPFGERGGLNLYNVVENDLINSSDYLGLIGWGVGGSPGQVDITYGGVPSRQEHYDRNRHQEGQLPSSPQDARNQGWDGSVPADFHQQGNYSDGRDSSLNQKYVSPDGTMEVIFDENGGKVNDPVNQGTYNFGPPDNFIDHTMKDVIPYYLYGNSEGDPVPWYDRIFGTYDGEIPDDKETGESGNICDD